MARQMIRLPRLVPNHEREGDQGREGRGIVVLGAADIRTKYARPRGRSPARARRSAGPMAARGRSPARRAK